MKKTHQLLPNIAFFGAIGLIYFGLIGWANMLSSILIVLFVYFDEIKEETAFKYAIQNFGSFLLFIPLAYFQLSVLPIGLFVFLLGLIIAHLRLTNFRSVVPRLYFSLAAFITLGFYLPNKLAQFQTHTVMNENAPDFQIQNFRTGEVITKQDLKGKVVIANFWATWCGTCIKEMVPLNTVYEKYKADPNIVFAAINTPKWNADELSQIEKFVTYKGITLPIYLDESGEMTGNFDVSSIPTLFILDREGNIRVRHVGFPAGEDLENYLIEHIEALL